MSRMNQHQREDNALDDQEVVDILGTLQNIEDDEDYQAGDRGDVVGDDFDDTEDDSAQDEADEVDGTADEEVEEDTGQEEESTDGEAAEGSDVDEPTDQSVESEAGGEEESAKSNNENHFIPRARLNKEIQKRKDLQARLDALEAAQAAQGTQPPAQAQKQAEIDRTALEKAINGIIDGDVDNATDALVEVLKVVGQQQAPTSIEPEQIAAMVEQKFENDALFRRAGELIKEHTFLDDSNEDTFDSDAAEEVLLLRDRYVHDRGLRPVEALEKAVRMVGRDYGYINDAAPAPAPAPAPAEPKLKPADVTKKLAMAKKTPAPVPKGAGEQRGRISLATASESDFEKASADALRRARGDFL